MRRKKIQYALKELNYYASSIDGLYGPGTERALIGYAQAKALNKKYPYNIFRSALSQINTPSSFVAEKQPSTSSSSSYSPSSGAPSSIIKEIIGFGLKAGLCSALAPNTAACLSSAMGKSNTYGSISSSSSSGSSSNIPGYSNSLKRACKSDKQCGFRGKCVKRLNESICVIPVDQNGRKQRNRDTELLGCRRNSDCPRKFRCNRSMRICEKK